MDMVNALGSQMFIGADFSHMTQALSDKSMAEQFSGSQP